MLDMYIADFPFMHTRLLYIIVHLECMNNDFNGIKHVCMAIIIKSLRDKQKKVWHALAVDTWPVMSAIRSAAQ